MPQGFDLARKSKARQEVGVDAKTLEAWGTTFYAMGGCIFFSKSELEALIRAKGKVVAKTLSRAQIEKRLAQIAKERADLERMLV